MKWHGRTAQQWMGELATDESVEESPPNVARINALGDFIEAAPRRHSRQRRVRRLLGVGLAAAACAALLPLTPWFGAADAPSMAQAGNPGGTLVRLEGAVSVDWHSAAKETLAGAALQAGDAVITESTGSAVVEVAGGAELQVEGGSRVALGTTTTTQQGVHRRANVERGGVAVTVPKLELGSAFSVVTADTTVTVVGTQFRVWVGSDEGRLYTCVSVQEGKVRVESATRSALLSKAETWVSSGALSRCGIEEPAAVGEQPAVAASPKRKLREKPSAPPPAESSLEEQNALFLEAIRARREGQLERAQKLQQQFLQAYPDSPLAKQVQSEQAKTQKLLEK